jgi:hypothetical protein
MLLQVNTGNNIESREKLIRSVQSEVGRTLSRFNDRLTRVEIFLSDENGDKPGIADKRCVIETRPVGCPPVAVSYESATLEDAWTGAAKKLVRLLEAILGRANDHKGGASIREG